MLHKQTAKKGDFVGAGSATISMLVNYLYKPALHNQTTKKGDFVGRVRQQSRFWSIIYINPPYTTKHFSISKDLSIYINTNPHLSTNKISDNFCKFIRAQALRPYGQ